MKALRIDEEEVAGMCASDACHSLLADVEALNLTECTLPIGNNINLSVCCIYGDPKYHDSKYRDSDYYNSWYPVP
ncbi:hypothetical protein BBO99_00008922 [Phytophthora kernoviae]|uniref:Elicitin n=2 Tax=Phytophthora kernoviae TaxID=325452 RepID=A0A421GE26_9STRA|nr:hypothetical protein G195_010142 [Phytophthora kernoviae 00238/432]KAG2519281.1 hypothetical protein JM18_005457 [Phytophthora kernoviae]KAG2520023.1 hypothetical protein JM16_005572 [Phytophthora kernoviae]RLN38489.1 hypothetical protein BBI17_008943 [Phytophthora kernoviae]RLN74460.1 hypothetical protein BBO99_00008922 [Phytophthora kernoviae]